jgi:hypothetical protein
LKPERIRLLVHILRMIVQPYNQQHPSAQKLNLNVQRLQEATLEVMTPWFNDKEHPDNAQKSVFFKEIFKVAKQEERYLNGEIDATTRVPVLAGDSRNAMEFSDDDDGKEDEEEQSTSAVIAASTPDSSMVSPAMIQAPSMHAHSEHDAAFQNRNSIPVRYTTPQLDTHQTSFNDVSYLPRTSPFQSTSPIQQDSNRRAYPSPTYHNPQQPMYSWGQQGTMVSNGPNAAYYVSAGQNMPPQSTAFQLPPPTSVAQTMLPPPLGPHHYELSTAPRFDPGPSLGNQLRAASLGHNQQMHHGLADYYHDNSVYTHNDAEHQG